MKADERDPRPSFEEVNYRRANLEMAASKRPQVLNAEFWKSRVWKLQVWEAERTNAAR
jgi:hypothetical protein